ncbi:MAG: STAS domain-containing protein [Planctomycetes bacterium]|jgi:anti-sigma B factor antagonist|nr:STAS domain-containing protein [Planctomycetota bacterium]
MKIEQSQQGTVTVLTPVGALVDDEREQLEQVLEKHLDAGRVKLIIDMNSVPFVESEGLEMLLDASERAVSRGGGIRITNPSDIVRDIILATRLNAKIELHFDLADARRSLL